MSRVFHDFGPVCDPLCRVLILGSMPSVRSRAAGFYYMHPQNRFWRVIATLTNEPFPETIEERQTLCHRHHIALWDVIASCEIEGSSDQSIREPSPNDIPALISDTAIAKVYTNGKTADRLYKKFFPHLQLPATCLPSTSPANAAYSLDRLVTCWQDAIGSSLTLGQ